jgi:hypothetical protein
MAAVSTKKRVFGSVFGSQDLNHLNQLSNRSWLNLPPIWNDSDILEFKSFKSNEQFIEDAVRLPPETLTWFTNHVRRHYLNQVLPIVQNIPTIEISRVIQVLEGAHRLYFDRFGLILKRMNIQDDARTAAVRNFRLNLSTVVSNSIPDRSAIKTVVRRHVSVILNRSTPENDLLVLIRSLCNVGLGGEKYESRLNCSDLFNNSY